MRRVNIFFCVLGAICFIQGLAIASPILPYNDKLHVTFSVNKDSIKAITKELKLRDIDIAGVDLKDQVIGVIVDEVENEWLNQYVFTHEGVFKLKEEVIYPLKDLVSLRYPDAQYFNPDTLENALKELNSKYPNISRLISVGKSLNGRDIWALRIGAFVGDLVDPYASLKKPAVLFNAEHHAREVMTPEVAFDIANELLRGFGNDEKLTQYVNELDIWVVPMVNPDGSNRVFNYDGMWRKNTRASGSKSSWFFDSIFGVDLNRNYGYDWGGDGSSSVKSSQTYRGTEAFSEPESRALAILNEKIRFAYTISYHSYSEMVLYPYSSDKKTSSEETLLYDLAKNMAIRLKSDTGSGTYTFGKSWEILYAVGGSDDDYHYAEFGTMAFTIETNSSRRGFQPSYDEWRNTEVQIQRPAWNYLLERAMRGPSIAFTATDDVTGLPIQADVEIDEIIYHHGEKGLKTNKAGYFYHAVMPGTYHVAVKIGGNLMQKFVFEVK